MKLYQIKNKIKCLLGLHNWDERCERLTCMTCGKDIYFDDKRIKDILSADKYRHNSKRNLYNYC